MSEDTKQTETSGVEGPGETAQVSAEPPKPIGYDLTPGEQMQFHALNASVVNKKLVVYNLNAALEQALKEVVEAQERFTGALQFASGSHGMGACQITEDFKRIFPLGGQ